MSVRRCMAGVRKVRRRAVALTMLFSLIVPQMAPPVGAQRGGPLRFMTSGATDAPERTVQELRRRWDEITVPSHRFDQAPSVQLPYRPGQLSGDFIRQNLELVNLFRYSAGLPFVSDSAADDRSAQYGAVLLAAANTLDHQPARPADMDAAVYQRGCEALGAGNIGYLKYIGGAAESRKCADAIPTLIRNYMNDRGGFNRSCVPHRRWLLYPGLQTVGVGCADSADGTIYQVLKVLGTQGGTARVNYDFIAWPASGVFPAQVISPGVPWSVSLNPGVFEIPDRTDLTVTVIREDGRVWKLDAGASADSADARFLLVDEQRYGLNNCILFSFDPGRTDLYRGSYLVTVEGLTTLDGDAAMLDYEIRFVDMEETGCDLGLRSTNSLPAKGCGKDPCPSSRFTDAPAQDNWAHNGVDFVLENGYFSGTGSNTFSPKGTMTRAMMVTVLWRVAGMPETEGTCAFTDVKESAYYSRAVRWASQTGLVNGISADRFGPDGLLTRAQAVTLLCRYFASQTPASADSLRGFCDADAVGNYARAAFSWAVENGVVTGQSGPDGGQYLLPNDHITREQAAAILMRCMTEL